MEEKKGRQRQEKVLGIENIVPVNFKSYKLSSYIYKLKK